MRVEDGELVALVLQEPDLRLDLEPEPVWRRVRVSPALVTDGAPIAQDDEAARFVRRFVSDRSLVEDLVCDTFFAAWQQAPHFENRSSVATWLMAIARYKALSARERQTLPTEPLDEVLATTIVETGLQPDAVVERDDWARFLRQCLNSLPAEQAQLIELVYYRDKSIKEVALLMGIPENTVKSRMFLARKKLSAMLAAADLGSDTVDPEKKSPDRERESQTAA